MAKLPDTPEGMAVDSKGNLYTTLLHSDEVIMLKDDGSYDHVAWVPSKEESGNGDLIRLDFDKAPQAKKSLRHFEQHVAPGVPGSRGQNRKRSAIRL